MSNVRPKNIAVVPWEEAVTLKRQSDDDLLICIAIYETACKQWPTEDLKAIIKKYKRIYLGLEVES